MKDKRKNNQIISLSKEIATLEKELQLGKNIQENQKKIEILMSTLSLEEMLQLNDYIMEHNLI